MKILGTRDVPIASLLLPGNWREILDDPIVSARAASIERVGLLHPPMVRQRDMKLIHGRRRVAACLLLGRDTVEVKLVDCTNQEMEIAMRMENVERDYDPSARAKAEMELLDLLTQEEEKRDPDTIPSTGHKPKTAKGRARAALALQLGVKPESIRQREFRAKQGEPAVPKEKKAEAPIETLGIELDESFVRQMGEIKTMLTSAASKMALAHGNLTALLSRDLPVPTARLTRVKEQIGEAGAMLRALVPTTLCPYCKGVDEVQKQCAGCAATGYLTKDQVAQVPDEYWGGIVIFQGDKQPIGRWVPAELPDIEKNADEDSAVW